MLKILPPASIRFFMESSGSMNGFLRAGIPTYFKTDLWEIISYYRTLIPEISVLSTDGGATQVNSLQVAQFQNPLNGGGFISAQSTNLCQMINNVAHSIHPERGDVAVLVSDMEYDPVGAIAPDVLKSVYSTDIAAVLSDFGYSAALVAATSNSVDKDGNTLTTKRPYYYVILGRQECVAYVRNGISAMLDEQKHFVDNIETGFKYGGVKYSIGRYSGCTQIGREPSFSSVIDTGCSFDLNVKLENYRWILSTSKDVLKKSFHISSMNGSSVVVDSITYDIKNVVNNELKRDVTAKIHVRVKNMPAACDILKWSIAIPYTDDTVLQTLFTDTPNSVEQTYSIREFIIGMFRASLTCTGGKENYIHLSKD